MNRFEQLIEYVINDEEAKARELFHDIVVEKSRQIYENIMAEEADEDLDENLYVTDAPKEDACNDVPGAPSNSSKNSQRRVAVTPDAPVKCADAIVRDVAFAISVTLVERPANTIESPTLNSVFAAVAAPVTVVEPAVTLYVPVNVLAYAVEDGQVETLSELPKAPAYFAMKGPMLNDAVSTYASSFLINCPAPIPPEPVAVSVVAFNAVFATRTTKSGEE